MRTLPDPVRLVPLALCALFAAAAAPAAEVEGDESGAVARSAVTTEIVEREPANRVDVLGTDHAQVFYFTEIRDQAGRTLTHRWSFEDEVMAEVPFTIEGPRWRVYSSKKLLPAWSGRWTVAVVDETGAILKQDHFTYGDAPPAAAAAPAGAAEPPTPPATPAAPAPTPPEPGTE